MPDAEQKSKIPLRPIAGKGRSPNPDLHLGIHRWFETRGRDADHAERLAVEYQFLSRQVRIGAQPLPPNLFVDDDDLLRARTVLARRKHSTDDRLEIENLKEICRHVCAAHAI